MTAVFVDPSHHWMSAAVPGPKVVSHRSHQRGVAGVLPERLVHDAQPVLGGRPGRLVEPPVPGVAPAQRLPLEAEVGEHPGGDRHGPVPGLVGGAADHPGQLRDLGAELGGGRRPCRQAGERRVAGGVEPRLPVGGDAAGGDGLGDPLALRGRHPCRGAAPRRGQQLTWEDEQRPPHRELLHHRPGVVQLRVDVLGLDSLGAGGDREVHGGRLGRVQDRHRAGHRGDVGQPVRRRQRVSYGDPAAALGVADPPSCHRRRARSLSRGATCRAGRASAGAPRARRPRCRGRR